MRMPMLGWAGPRAVLGRTIRRKISQDQAAHRQSDAHKPDSIIGLRATVLQAAPLKPSKLPLSCAFNTVT